MNVLVTGVGGPTPRSFANALRNFGRYREARLVATDCNRYAIGLYQKHLFAASYLVPPANAPDYWGAIRQIVERECIDCAVVLPEIEVLEWANREQAGTLPCKALLPPYDLARQLVDKASMTKLLEDSGLVPRSAVISGGHAKLDQNFPLSFPFWVREAAGSCGAGALKINNSNELSNWMAINPGVRTFLASQYLPGRNLGCKLLYYEGRLLRAAVGERVQYIMAKVAPSGITGNTSFGRLLNAPEVFEVARCAMDILFEKTNSRHHGFFTVDLKEDDHGVPKVTEVNVRHVAFTQCFAAGGANFAEDTLRLLEGDETFDRQFRLHAFEPDLIFLRDVDALPILMKEGDLLS